MSAVEMSLTEALQAAALAADRAEMVEAWIRNRASVMADALCKIYDAHPELIPDPDWSSTEWAACSMAFTTCNRHGDLSTIQSKFSERLKAQQAEERRRREESSAAE